MHFVSIIWMQLVREMETRTLSLSICKGVLVCGPIRGRNFSSNDTNHAMIDITNLVTPWKCNYQGEDLATDGFGSARRPFWVSDNYFARWIVSSRLFVCKDRVEFIGRTILCAEILITAQHSPLSNQYNWVSCSREWREFSMSERAFLSHRFEDREKCVHRAHFLQKILIACPRLKHYGEEILRFMHQKYFIFLVQGRTKNVSLLWMEF